MLLPDISPVHATWTIAAAATGGVILRPFRLPEAVWAVAGAALLIGFGLIPGRDAFDAVMRGNDVYLFLAGMMLVAEVARREGLFDWLARFAVEHAAGSQRRLFALVYAVGVVVTALLSNDATAVVLTPAVYAAARAARAEPLPHLLVCAFVANAASFVLPISNPANLVVFGAGLPPLSEWVLRFALPSAASIVVTFLALYATQRRMLRGPLHAPEHHVPLSQAGRAALVGLAGTAVVMLAASAAGWKLGFPTAAAGVVTSLAVTVIARQSPVKLLAGISWGVLPLVAGLFILVEAVARTGILAMLSAMLDRLAQQSPGQAPMLAGWAVALACNLVNNLPAGLLAGSVVQVAHVPANVTSAILIGVDLGPNLSITGSLATLLWLVALRREGEHIGAWRFLRLGCVTMIPALVAALAALSLTGP